MKLERGNTGNRYFIMLCIMGSFAVLSSTMSKSPVLNPFATSLGTPNDLLGFVAAASTIPGILVSLPAASLSDIVGRRKILLFSAFVFSSAPFFYIFVTTWWQLLLVRFYHGFATAIFIPVVETIIAERFPTSRGEHISLLNSAGGIGRAVAPILGGFVLALTSYSFDTLYLAVSIAGITVFVFALLLRGENKPPTIEKGNILKATKQIFQGWQKVVSNRSAVLVSFIQASQYYVFGAFEFFIVGYIIGVARLDALFAGIILTAQVGTLIVARPIFGVLSDKKGRRIPIIAGSILNGLLLLIVPLTVQFPLLLLIAVGYGLGFAMVVSSTSPLMSEISPTGLVGASMGFLCTSMDIGQTLGPVISGVILSTAMQFTGLFVSLSLLLFISAIIFALQNRKNSKFQV